jgi:hypothetical protein
MSGFLGFAVCRRVPGLGEARPFPAASGRRSIRFRPIDRPAGWRSPTAADLRSIRRRRGPSGVHVLPARRSHAPVRIDRADFVERRCARAVFWCMFVTGGFQMLGLRTGARAYPGPRTASVAGVASGAWAAEAAIIQSIAGRWFDQGHYDWIFWAIALIPLVGVLMWLRLSRKRATDLAIG